MKFSDKNKGVIFVLLSAVLFATGGILIKSITWNSLSINGARSVFAFLVMFIYMKMINHRFVLNMPVVLGAIANTGMCISFTAANKLTTAANAIVLQFVMPAFVILLLWAFWKQKPDKLAVGTVLFSFIGIICFFMESLGGGRMVGDILALLSGLLYAIVFVLKKIPKADFESSVLLSHMMSFAIGLPFLFQETAFTTNNIVYIILLGVFQLGIAFVCLNIGLNSVQPVAASLISMVEPILNPVLGSIFYGETMSPLAIVGAVIVLGSATFYNVYSVKHLEGA